MSKDTHSIASSEAATLAGNNGKQQEEHTTLHGRPIRRDHDNLSNMMLGDGAGASPTVGANLLPPGFTDRSRVHIPIKMSEIEGGAPDSSEVKAEKKGGLFKKFSGKRKDDEEIKVVMMSRGDYLRYWAKGNDGKYLDSVVEPPEGRKEWLRKQLELIEQMKRDDPSLGKQKISYSASELLARGIAGGAS